MSGPVSGSGRAYLLAGGVVGIAAAAAIAFVQMPAPHPGGDNAAYLSLAHALGQGSYIELWDPELVPHNKYPPGFPAMLAVLVMFGASSWGAFKLLTAVLVSLAVLAVFAWASARRGPLAGAAVALLTLFSAGWLDASRWILSEPAFLVFTFLALWAGERALGEAPEGGPTRKTVLKKYPVDGWLLAAGAAVIAAFLTRSAGLPLVIALAAALLLVRRRGAALVFGAAFAVPAAWWGLRARLGGEGAYQSEFWMVNPYEPELGTVGWLALPVRAWTNLRLYVGEVLPAEWWGGAGPGALWALGLALVGLAAWGWAARLHRDGPGVTELFLPLYLGLILVWPEVWSGDRFILPVYPLLLLYAGERIVDLGGRMGEWGRTALPAAAFLILAVPALPGWMTMAEDASLCRAAAQGGDVFRCHGAGMREFRDAAAWSGLNLPAGAVVLNRKPRIHYALGGSRGRTFPFTQDPEALLAEADGIGARYLLLDHVDGIAPFYLTAVIRARPLAFCHLWGWGGEGGVPGTDLFGILPPDAREVGGDVSQLRRCPAEYLARDSVEPVREGRRVPILAGAGIPVVPRDDQSSSPPP